MYHTKQCSQNTSALTTALLSRFSRQHHSPIWSCSMCTQMCLFPLDQAQFISEPAWVGCFHTFAASRPKALKHLPAIKVPQNHLPQRKAAQNRGQICTLLGRGVSIPEPIALLQIALMQD